MNRCKRNRPMGGAAPHYPNKEEGKALRRLMSISGSTKDEVMSNKLNRRIVAEAARISTQGDRKHREDYHIKILKRRIAAMLNVPTYDPAVTKRFNEDYEVSFYHGIRRRH